MKSPINSEFGKRLYLLILTVGMFLSACSTQTPLPSRPQVPQPRKNIVNVPETVELPAGKFYMGDQSGIGDRDERPVQQVEIASFAISKYEISFKQFDEFSDATGQTRVDDRGWGRNQLPVINVSWEDARAYTQWLSLNTGQKWRLPSEAEWEYAARAGKYSNYQSGNQQEAVCSVGNIADQKAYNAGIATQITQCDDGAVHTKQVGSYSANSFGLYDMHGNLWEWVADCYAAYADNSGSVQCEKRVIRGGSFLTPAMSARVSNREALMPSERLHQVGFRVVREL